MTILASLGFAESAAAAGARRPNIVVLVADDLGYADLGFQGGKDIPTPHLDALAAAGVRCTNGYVSGPYCSPTRAGLLTGRYQQRFGHEFNPGRGDARRRRPAAVADDAGRPAQGGRVRDRPGRQVAPRRGAEVPPAEARASTSSSASSAAPTPTSRSESDDIYRGTEPVKESDYLTDAFGREAVAFIDRHKGHPFFLYLAFNAVHTPMDATDDRLARFASIADKTRRTYAAMLSALDDAVGAVLAKLREAGLEEDTLVVFFSDNGGPTMLGTTINGSRNDPLRGSKRTTLEGGHPRPVRAELEGQAPGGQGL